jgi:hypothetical protein
MSEHRGILYKTRWEILVMAAALVLSAVTVLAIPNDFTAKMLEQQKMQKQAEAEEKGMQVTLEEEIGFTGGTGKNMTAINSTDTKP